MTELKTFTLQQRLTNFSASLVLILATYLLYNLAPYYQETAAEELKILTFHFVNGDAVKLFYLIYSLLHNRRNEEIAVFSFFI